MANIPSDILDNPLTHGLDMTISITSFVTESITAHSALVDSYVILHAALITRLHRVVGVEFGRSALFATRYD